MTNQISKAQAATMRRIEITAFGEPEALQLTQTPIPIVADNDVRIRVAYAGLNFADIMQRKGRYPGLDALPFTPGMEVFGTVDAVGGHVTDIVVGARVLAKLEMGGYAEYAVTTADRVFAIAAGIGDCEALALAGTQGQTAYGVVQSLKAPDGRPIFISAAAGGVGSLLIQLCKARGWPVIAGVSSAEKADLARRLGADDVIRYDQMGWQTKLLEAAPQPDGLAAALDSVGGDIYRGAFASLGDHAEIVFFGAASGEPVGMPPELAFPAIIRCQAARGFGLIGYYGQETRILSDTVNGLFSARLSGEIGTLETMVFPFADAADAHRAVEGRRSTGKVILEVGS